MKILIVEDHQKINRLLTRFARQDGHEVSQAYDAESALLMLDEKPYDLIITDLMLPDLQGEDLIRRVRQHSDIYIMVISAKTEVSDRIDVITMGADDYVTKPFSVEEVMAKLQNVAKRLASINPLIYSYHQGELVVHPLTRTVLYKNEPVTLTTYEYDVLFHLMTHPNRIFKREELMMTLFQDSDAYDRVIDAYIKNIRKKIKDDPKHPTYIKTIYGLGYQFTGDADD